MPPGPKRDYYDILEVSRGADTDEIKRAYRKLAIRHHPDRNPEDAQAEENFKEVVEAYAVLSDPEKRRLYDQFGRSGVDNSGGRPDFSVFQEMLGGLVGELMGRKGPQRPPPRDLNYDLELTFEEAALGIEKTIEYERNVVCSRCGASRAEPGSRVETCLACQGRGEVPFKIGFFTAHRVCPNCEGRKLHISTPCTACNGSGRTRNREQISVRIPAGVDNGAIRTIRGSGEQTLDGSGNLHVNIRIKKHPIFVRDGADISCEIPISFPQAALSAEIEVPTLQGKVKMKVPAGTQSGHVFRLRGKGLPVFGGYGKGDQLVKILVEVPSPLNERQRHLLQQLADELNADAQPQQKSFLEKLRNRFG